MRKLIEIGIDEIKDNTDTDLSQKVVFVMNGKTDGHDDHISLFKSSEKNIETRPNDMPEFFHGKKLTLIRWDHPYVTGPKVISINNDHSMSNNEMQTNNPFAIFEINQFDNVLVKKFDNIDERSTAVFTIDGKISFKESFEIEKKATINNVVNHADIEENGVKYTFEGNEYVKHENKEYKTGFKTGSTNDKCKFGYLLEKVEEVSDENQSFDDKVFVQYTDIIENVNDTKYYGYGSFHVAIPKSKYDDIYKEYITEIEKSKETSIEASGGKMRKSRRRRRRGRSTRRRKSSRKSRRRRKA